MAKLESKFSLVGQFQGFILEDGYKIKYLKLEAGDREYIIKLAKNIRHSAYLAAYPGCWLEVKGRREEKPKTGQVKFKAETFKLVETPNPADVQSVVVPQPQVTKLKKPKESILVCQKSSCWKRGGKEVCQAIEASLRDRTLDEQVKVKLTGCLKQCKKGPNVVMMPDKALYSKVKPKQVPTLIEEHFVDNVKEPAS